MRNALLVVLGATSIASAADAGFLGFVASTRTAGGFTFVDVFCAVSNASDKFLNVYNANITTTVAGGFYQSSASGSTGWKPDTVIGVATRASYDSFMSECDAVLGQYLRGQILVMLVLSVFYAVALTLFGLDLALPIGVFTGLAVCVPYLGFGLGMILALLAGLLQFASLKAVIMVAVVYGAGQLIESFWLTPKLVGERIGLHPLTVIFALMALGQLFGFVGVLVALPVSAVLLVAIRRARDQYFSSNIYQGPSA
jgi:hypothetical protein